MLTYCSTLECQTNTSPHPCFLRTCSQSSVFAASSHFSIGSQEAFLLKNGCEYETNSKEHQIRWTILTGT